MASTSLEEWLLCLCWFVGSIHNSAIVCPHYTCLECYNCTRTRGNGHMDNLRCGMEDSSSNAIVVSCLPHLLLQMSCGLNWISLVCCLNSAIVCLHKPLNCTCWACVNIVREASEDFFIFQNDKKGGKHTGLMVILCIAPSCFPLFLLKLSVSHVWCSPG